MKTFKQFNKEVNEAAALVTALPKIVSVASKLPKIAKFASGALKLGSSIPVGLGIANVLQSKTSNQDKGEEEIKQRKQAEDEEVGKAIGMNPGDRLPPVSRVKQNIKRGIEQYKKGLRAGLDVEKTSSTGPIGSASDEFREKEKGRTPAQVVYDLLKKQRREYKRQRIKNKKIDRDLER